MSSNICVWVLSYSGVQVSSYLKQDLPNQSHSGASRLWNNINIIILHKDSSIYTPQVSAYQFEIIINVESNKPFLASDLAR